MPNNNNTNNIKWKDVLEEESSLRRKLEMITIRNTIEMVKVVADTSTDFKDFANKLQIAIDKLEREINKQEEPMAKKFFEIYNGRK